MAIKLSTKWYIAFATVLTAIGTFLVTTDPVFHYGDMFKSDHIDTTKIVSMSTTESDSIHSILTDKNEDLPMGKTQMEREIRRLKSEIQDTLKPLVKKHEEFFK